MKLFISVSSRTVMSGKHDTSIKRKIRVVCMRMCASSSRALSKQSLIFAITLRSWKLLIMHGWWQQTHTRLLNNIPLQNFISNDSHVACSLGKTRSGYLSDGRAFYSAGVVIDFHARFENRATRYTYPKGLSKRLVPSYANHFSSSRDCF